VIGLMIAGVDEVGRGPIAGPVVAGAVVLDPSRPIVGLRDSKALSESKRSRLSEHIKQDSLAWSLGRAEAHEIDQINILNASLLAMSRALTALKVKVDLALVDGNRLPKLSMPARWLIKGDQRVGAIQAGAIIAKVARDSEMSSLDSIYPGYGFASHKGYPTAKHKIALAALGLTPQHRLSFEPCKSFSDGQR